MSTPCKKQHDRPCAECPFNKQTAPGLLGGSPPETYVGQISGPFMLACHMIPDYEKDRRNPELPQCAGAAIFRANTGVDERLPPALLHLPVDRESVFGSFEEFYAHHHGIPVWAAAELLRKYTPDMFLMLEMKKQGVQHVKVKLPP